MNITVFGSGYVGLVVALCFAEVGNQVVCVDVDASKIDRLQSGKSPIYEPGLEERLARNLKSQRIVFTTDIKQGVKHGLCQFIAVGTPPDASGKADLQYVSSVATSIGQYLEDYTIIINKSTVPIGTADHVQNIIQTQLAMRGKSIPFDVVSNPEFLREGAALEDFRDPDRIVLGVESERAESTLRELYAPFNTDNDRLITMDKRSAELTKYAANAMLATKISFINEIANLAENVGADIELVRTAIGADPRIGYHFINPGCGYGGSCFGKDVQALINTAHSVGAKCELIQAVESVNARQKLRLFEKISEYYKSELSHKTFAIWGLSFKPETDDMRDAPSIPLIASLIGAGARVQAYDPEAQASAKTVFEQLGVSSGLFYADSPEAALEGADALVIVTEWRAFRSPDFEKIKMALSDNVIFDGRNIYDPAHLVPLSIRYIGIGRKNVIFD